MKTLQIIFILVSFMSSGTSIASSKCELKHEKRCHKKTTNKVLLTKHKLVKPAVVTKAKKQRIKQATRVSKQQVRKPAPTPINRVAYQPRPSEKDSQININVYSENGDKQVSGSSNAKLLAKIALLRAENRRLKDRLKSKHSAYKRSKRVNKRIITKIKTTKTKKKPRPALYLGIAGGYGLDGFKTQKTSEDGSETVDVTANRGFVVGPRIMGSFTDRISVGAQALFGAENRTTNSATLDVSVGF